MCFSSVWSPSTAAWTGRATDVGAIFDRPPQSTESADWESDTGRYRQVKSRVEPDGSWVRYNYDDHRRVVSEARPWLNAPADPVTARDADSRVLQYSYASLDPLDIANTLEGSTEQSPGFSTPRVVAERVQGKLVSLTLASVRQSSDGIVEIEERCPTPSASFGDVPYPVQYVYDAYGRRTEMHTYREDAGWSSSTWPEGASGDVTKWHYEEATGLLLSKEDAAGKAVTYTYGAAGRLATRTWARQKQGGGALRTTYGRSRDGRTLDRGLQRRDAGRDVRLRSVGPAKRW